MAVVEQQWACASCTFANDITTSVCEICGAFSPSSQSSSLREGEMWACVVCTFENAGADNMCAMCNTPHGSTRRGDLRPMCETCQAAPANIPFASCCRPCALNQACNCSATSLAQPSASPRSSAASLPRKRQANSSPKAVSGKAVAGSSAAASTAATSTTVAAAETSVGPSRDTLSTPDAFALFSECGASAAKASAEAESLTADLERILARLYKHVVEDSAQVSAAAARPAFTWEWQLRGSNWEALDAVDQLTVESERRAGRQECAITAASGERITLDLVAMCARFSLSQRTVPLRSVALNTATNAAAASSVATASMATKECQICFSDASVEVEGCGHTAACSDCLLAHACSRANGADAAAWIPCPHPGCQQPLSAQVLAQPGGPGWAFPIEWLSRTLTRLPEWAPCDHGSSSGSNGSSIGGSSGTGAGGDGSESHDSSKGATNRSACPGGVLVGRDNEGQSVPCPVCSQCVVAKRRAEEPDPEVQKMLADGVVRPCPACALPTLKEHGVCNVIQCERCSIWWNWRSLETGRNSRELKDRARMKGTLWEPGQLQYQQTLQASDPEAFAALLKRNGVEYDPNYRRGS